MYHFGGIASRHANEMEAFYESEMKKKMLKEKQAAEQRLAWLEFHHMQKR